VLVGRDAECRRIDAALGAAAVGRSLLQITGAAGIGKTSLLRYAATQVGGRRVLRATGVRGEADVAYAGLLELTHPVVSLVNQLPEPQSRALRIALALENPSAALDRFAIGAGLLSLLAAAAEGRGLLVLLDDFQWLDAPTAEAVMFAARRLADDPVAMLLAIREGEQLPVDVSDVPAIELRGLDRVATRLLAERVHGGRLAAEVAERIFAFSGGNPLAVTELRDTEAIALRIGAAPVSRRVESAYGARVAALDAATQSALLVVAADDGVALSTLQAALRDLGSDLCALDDAEAAGLIVRSDGRVTFHHPLVRSAVFQRATPDDRRRIHAALANALTAPTDRTRRILHRAEATEGADDELAADLTVIADEAMARHACAAAARAYERAAELTTVQEARAARLYGAGSARWAGGDGERARPLLDAALELTGLPELRADIQFARAEIVERNGDAEEAVRMLVEEGRRVAPADPARADRLLSEALYAATTLGDVARAVSTVRGAIAEAGVGARGRPYELCLLGRYDEALPLFEAALADISLDDQRDVERAGELAAWLGTYPAAYRLTIRSLELAHEHGDPTAAAVAGMRASDQAFVAGEWHAAAAYGEEGLSIGRLTGQPAAIAYSLWSIGVLAAARGDTDGVTAAIDELAAALPRPLSWCAILNSNATICGYHHLAVGDALAAVAAYHGAIDLDFEQVGNIPITHGFDLAECLFRAGERRRAERVLDRLSARAHQPWAVASLLRTRGWAGVGGDAEDDLRRALEIGERDGMVFEAARTRFMYGEWLRRLRRRADARDQLRPALDTFDRLGARPWAARVRAELQASGEKRATRHQGWLADDLTPQEYRVASLAAEGLANREIAQRLFLSTKTIEAHLHRAYGKLGIRRREEIRAALERARGARH
jgi:DNA-binding CsgD family transcriptional regulator